MRNLGWVLLCGWLAISCTSSTRVESELEVNRGDAAGAAAVGLTRMLVTRGFGAYRRGDTVSVALDEMSEDGDVLVYGSGRSTGGMAPSDALGIIGTGPMVVAVGRADVRRCRSKGCSVVGYVTRGQLVQVHDYFDRWYRYTDPDGNQGYIWAEYLRAPALLRRATLAEFRRRTADYFERRLAGLSVGRDGSLFAGYELELADELLKFNFYTAHREGPAMVEICNAMRGIASFVEGLVAEAPSEILPAYSAGIYFDEPDTPGKEDLMVAGLAGGGSVYCEGP